MPSPMPASIKNCRVIGSTRCAWAARHRPRHDPGPVTSDLRPHLRAVYGFARLVDILGDEVEGDRLAALDQLEGEVDACYAGEPAWPVMRE